MRLPKMFIGCSTESLDIAYVVQELLEHHAEIKVWDQGAFGVSQFFLESLLNTLSQYDCGLFIFTPDDISHIRGSEHATVRDNVIFELGLYIGRLGKERTFILVPSIPEVRLPSDLLGLTPAKFNPDNKDIYSSLGAPCNRIRLQLRSIKNAINQRSAPASTATPRTRFSDILNRALNDEKISSIKCVTYTAEVDGGLINEYRVRSKKIEIYKRSPLADLVEEQSWNLKRLSEGINTRLWRKRAKSIQVCESFARVATALKGKDAELVQYLYDAPPSKRAYLLDDEIVSAYYNVEDDLSKVGSVYQGMEDATAPAVVVTRADPQWAFVQSELDNFLKGLRRSASRTWEQEREILLHGGCWTGHGLRPCIDPKVVFFDVDGVLLNSLPQYVASWKAAFREVGVDLPESVVYEEEGRRGKETISKYFAALGHTDSPEVIKRVHSHRQEEFKRLGFPPVMDGAHDLLKKVRDSNLEIWVVTGSSDPELRSRLASEFQGFVMEGRIIMGEDTYMGKPSPDPYQFGCAKATVHPHNAIAIENGPLGIRSADQAGVFCIGVNTGILAKSRLEESGARVVFESCKALANVWQEAIEILKPYEA